MRWLRETSIHYNFSGIPTLRMGRGYGHEVRIHGPVCGCSLVAEPPLRGSYLPFSIVSDVPGILGTPTNRSRSCPTIAVNIERSSSHATCMCVLRGEFIVATLMATFFLFLGACQLPTLRSLVSGEHIPVKPPGLHLAG